jgi:hypothetical protein
VCAPTWWSPLGRTPTVLVVQHMPSWTHPPVASQRIYGDFTYTPPRWRRFDLLVRVHVYAVRTQMRVTTYGRFVGGGHPLLRTRHRRGLPLEARIRSARAQKLSDVARKCALGAYATCFMKLLLPVCELLLVHFSQQCETMTNLPTYLPSIDSIYCQSQLQILASQPRHSITRGTLVLRRLVIMQIHVRRTGRDVTVHLQHGH